ncbi:MAG: sigma-70 family RNA polymerase sigma factor [candidate division WOR-3 bacterium]|nr:sigma-70 family RNA polymerase sigma factor [candidate division WOR-3 bacterium]
MINKTTIPEPVSETIEEEKIPLEHKQPEVKALEKKPQPQALPVADSELVKRAQAGDNLAFTELVKRYEHKVYNIAYRMLGSEEEAKDAMQDVFIRVYRFLKKFRSESSFYTWIYRITTNVCLTRLKQRQKEDKTYSLDEPTKTSEDELTREIPDYRQSPEEIYQRERMRKVLQLAINELPADYRTVVVLRDLQGLSNKEISKTLKISVAAVKSRLHRGRVFLREKLEKYLQQ